MYLYGMRRTAGKKRGSKSRNLRAKLKAKNRRRVNRMAGRKLSARK